MKNETHGGAAVQRGTGILPASRIPANGEARNGNGNGHGQDAHATFGKPQFHPLALAFPPLRPAQLEMMIQDIRTRGSPVVLRRGETILGDPNVHRACTEAGVAVQYREWDGIGSLPEVVARSILPAAQFDESQRAVIAVAISDELSSWTVPSGINGGRGNLGNIDPKTAFPANGSVAAQCAATGNGEILLGNSSAIAVGDRVTLNTPKSIEGTVINRGGGQFFVEWDLAAGEPASRRKSRAWCAAANLKKIHGQAARATGRAAEIAGELCQVSTRYVYEARKLRDENRELFEQVRTGLMNLSGRPCCSLEAGEDEGDERCPLKRQTPG